MLNRSLLLLILCSLLSACVAVMVAGAAASMIVYDSRSVSTLESDARIFHTVHTRIVRDDRFRESRINVVSFNRVLLLVGQTSTPASRTLAQEIAQETPGVVRIYATAEGAPQEVTIAGGMVSMMDNRCVILAD